jgi:MoxR-like ATPase
MIEIEEHQKIKTVLNERIIGQSAAIDDLIVALIAGGHVTIEGMPGVGKTSLARALADALSLSFKRIQFTPDLMPSDITGQRVFDPRDRTFTFQQGPVFTDVLLADELNRTPPKTQAALLEAMAERQVTVDGERHVLSPLLFVIATKNPADTEGTYALPEAQTDRFMLQVLLAPPSDVDERALLSRSLEFTTAHAGAQAPLCSRESLVRMQQAVRTVHVSEDIVSYVQRLLAATRSDARVRVGASPRTGLQWLMAARARAWCAGRDHALPADVQSLARPVLSHRLRTTTDALLDDVHPADIVTDLLSRVPVVIA